MDANSDKRGYQQSNLMRFIGSRGVLIGVFDLLVGKLGNFLKNKKALGIV